jgi:drug/metabolite transporter (DMT)-like permease
MLVIQLFRQAQGKTSLQIKIPLNELPWLLGVVIFGGVAGPVFLMYGLSHTSAASASLLLNLEGVATAVLAWLVFKEHYDRRIVIGMIAIILGGCVLSYAPQAPLREFLGPLLVALACLSWGIDNNLTRKISLNDPILITLIKSLGAGVTNLIIAFSLGAKLPAQSFILQALVLGFVCYGLSIVCFILALRWLGASRTGAYFSIAPFFGALVAISIFHESITLKLVVAAILMGIGIYLHLTESHDHEHRHEEMDHSHSHIHDEHHQHSHGPDVSLTEPHTHMHHHSPLVHRHPHFPDMHHTHSHGPS